MCVRICLFLPRTVNPFLFYQEQLDRSESGSVIEIFFFLNLIRVLFYMYVCVYVIYYYSYLRVWVKCEVGSLYTIADKSNATCTCTLARKIIKCYFLLNVNLSTRYLLFSYNLR